MRNVSWQCIRSWRDRRYKNIKAGKKMQKNENESVFFVWGSAQKQQFACLTPILAKIRKRGILREKGGAEMAKGLSDEQKVAIVLEGLKGQTSVAELCRKNGISQSQYYKWRDRFLEGGSQALKNRKSNSNAEYLARISELEKALGRATMKYEILKKNEELMGR